MSSVGDILEFNEPFEFPTVRDFAFEEGLQFQAYRIDADRLIYSAGASFELTSKLSLSAAFSYLDASGEFDNDYENSVGTVGVQWRF